MTVIKTNRMEDLPKVSVLIPTYNYAHFLDEAIQTVLNQTFTDFEIIIVDNHSNDNTSKVVEKYLTDKRVSYYINPINLGIVGNFNKCLEYAKGEYIKFLMADDKFHPNLLEKFVAVMEQYPTVTLVTSYREVFGLKSKILKPAFEGFKSGNEVIKECLRGGRGNCIGEPSTVMFRRRDLKIGNFKTDYSCLVDLNMWLRLLTVGDCYAIPAILSYFRVHETQDSSIKNLKNRFDEYYFYKGIKKNNDYKANLSDIDIDSAIKKKAIKCAKAMYKVLPSLYKKGNRNIFIRAFQIAYTEKVLFQPLLQALHKKGPAKSYSV